MAEKKAVAALPVDPNAVVAIVRQAGQLVVEMQARGLRDIHTKSTSVDLVTEADLASEQFLSEQLGRLDPSIDFWGEESNEPPDAEYYWIVDPIDGTVNYASGVPFYSISVALNRQDTTLLGLVLALPGGDLFQAQLGHGAFRVHPNGRQERLQVNAVDRLENATLTTGFPYHRTEHPDNNAAEFTQLLSRCRSIRCLGSAAIELALVAAGVTTAHWEAWLNPWDVAAGALLLQEAGGILTTYGGDSYSFANKSVIASNGQAHLHRAMVENLQAVRRTLEEKLFLE